MNDKLLEAANRLAHQLSADAFNAGVEDAGDAWTRQEKTAIKQNQTLASLLNAISALAAQAEPSTPPAIRDKELDEARAEGFADGIEAAYQKGLSASATWTRPIHRQHPKEGK